MKDPCKTPFFCRTQHTEHLMVYLWNPFNNPVAYHKADRCSMTPSDCIPSGLDDDSPYNCPKTCYEMVSQNRGIACEFFGTN